MSDNFQAGLMNLWPGDCVQRDRGMVIVEVVGSTTADCIDLVTRKSIVICDVAVPKHLIIERRGPKGLAEFMATKKDKDKIELQLGEQIVIGGIIQTVFEINGDKVKLGDLDGNWRVEDLHVKKFYLPDDKRTADTRMTELERELWLKHFLTTRKPPASEPVEGAAAKKKETESEESMATKKRSSKSKGKITPNGEKTGQIFGHSVNSVLLAVGRLGATTDGATEVLAKHGIDKSAAYVKRVLKCGKTIDSKATLSTEQKAEFGL